MLDDQASSPVELDEGKPAAAARTLRHGGRSDDGHDRERKSGLPWWGRYGVLITTVALIVVFSLTTPTFATLENFQIIGGSNSIGALVALGALVPLMVGEFDLSVGAELELTSVLVAVLVGQDHWSLVAALIVGIGAAVAVGVANGVMVAFFGVGSFIATLASASVVSGISLYLTKGEVLFSGIPESLRSFAQGLAGPIPNLVIVAAVIAAVLWYLSERTTAGRQTIATGLNKDAAQLMGVPSRRLTIVAFAAAGLLSGAAGFLLLGRVGSASSGIGTTYLLPALAAGFLGATTVKVGRFNVLGTIIAVILVAVGLSGLELNGVPNWVEPVFDGGVLALAVSASRFAEVRASR